MCGGGGQKAPKEDKEAKADRKRAREAEQAELRANKEKAIEGEVRKQKYRQGTRSLLAGGRSGGYGTNFYDDEGVA